jgi:hypothetical protein
MVIVTMSFFLGPNGYCNRDDCSKSMHYMRYDYLIASLGMSPSLHIMVDCSLINLKQYCIRLIARHDWIS